jgi:hypothetical protein
MEKLVIIPCGGAKLTEPAPAADIYIGSMFADTLRTARTMTSDENIRILSAKHGLMKLDEIVEPYNVKMGDADSISADDLRDQVTELHEQYSHFDYRIHTLLPKAYYRELWAAVHTGQRRAAFKLWNHFDGCAGIGYQKAALKNLRNGIYA